MAAFQVNKDYNNNIISTHADVVNHNNVYTRTVYITEKHECECDKKQNRADRRSQKEKLGCFKKFYGK